MPARHTVYLFRERVSPAASILMDMYIWYSHGSCVPEGNTWVILCRERRFTGVICIIRVYGIQPF